MNTGFLPVFQRLQHRFDEPFVEEVLEGFVVQGGRSFVRTWTQQDRIRPKGEAPRWRQRVTEGRGVENTEAEVVIICSSLLPRYVASEAPV
jgi:hypothetical protein